MSLVYTDITLENSMDVGFAKAGYIKESEVRRLEVKALVDTGAYKLVINEKMRMALGLSYLYSDTAHLAGGSVEDCNICGPVFLHWHDRMTACEAAVLPNEENVLLGAIPLEALDLVVHPKGEVVGAHGDNRLLYVK